MKKNHLLAALSFGMALTACSLEENQPAAPAPDHHSDLKGTALLVSYSEDIPLFGMRVKDGNISDNRDDLAFFRPSNSTWYFRSSMDNFTTTWTFTWGAPGDVPVSKMDVDGDRRSDLVVWRPSDGTWRILKSSSGYTNSLTLQWGTRGDIPLGGMDMGFDSKSDLVVWRPSDATFYVKMSSTNYTTQDAKWVGASSDIPVPDTDLDKDGKDDMVVWRPSTGMWIYRGSRPSPPLGPYKYLGSHQWGAQGDVPQSGTDLDGDGFDDIIVWRSSTGTTFVKLSSSNYTTQKNHTLGHVGNVFHVTDTDINGDGRYDLGYYPGYSTSPSWYWYLAPNFTSGPTY